MMKKKPKQSSPIIKKVKLPRGEEQFAVVIEMSGGSRFKAMCADGHTRMVRIGGKLKRRMWVRMNDLIVIKPWTVQTEAKADLVYRYLPTQRNWILRKNIVPEELNIW